MIKINLLPLEIVAERNRKAAQARMGELAVVAALILVVGFGGLLFLTHSTKEAVKTTQQTRQAVEMEIATYTPLVQLQSRVNTRIDLLQLAMGAQFGWRDTLSALGINIPQNVWLTNVALAFDGELGLLTLRGLTYNHPSTARWVESLQNIEGISDVRVSFSAEETVDTAELVRFEIRAMVGSGEEYTPLKRGQ